MLDMHKNMLRTHPSPSIKFRASLLPLRMALTAAERESPARPRRIDVNERLAMQLIARMQAGYKKANPFIVWREEPRGMAGGHAR
jgi:hypothetical protein